MTSLNLKTLNAVYQTDERRVYVAEIVMTDSNGNDLSGHYTSRPTDTYGIASAVRSAITEWIAAGKPVGTWKMSS